MTSSAHPQPIRRGEVWLINFEPTVGAEIRKTRPAVVVSADSVGKLPIKLVAPVTQWKDAFRGSAWLVRVDPTAANGLAKPSAVDVLQLRGVDTRRFVHRLGEMPATWMEQIAAAIGVVVQVS